MVELSEDTRHLITQIASRAPAGQAVPLDPADETHRALITELLNASGRGADRYPALHQAVAGGGSGAAPADPALHDATVVDVGKDSAGRATTRTWLASRGGAYISGAATLLMDAESGQILASGTAAQVGGTLVHVSTRSGEAKPATDRMTAVTFYHAQQAPDAAPAFGLVATTGTTQEEENGIQANVTDPAPVKHPGAETTVIGLSRTSYGSDCDYIYAPQPGHTDPTELAVPFTGNAPLQYEVDTTQGPPVAVTSKLYVNGMSGWLNPFPGFDLLTPVTASGYTVSWSFPPDQRPVEETASIQYYISSLANDNTSYFFFQFQVNVQNPAQPVVTFTVCSDDTPDEPSINCTKVRNIRFWWHCLGAGTRVALADGREVPIEEIDNTVTVRTGQGGGTGAVQATSRAPHHDAGGRAPALRLRTEGGRELLLSDGHPVVTPQGPVAARDLAPGDTVLTDGGEDRVASCEPEAYEGTVYNLKLAEEDGRPFGSFVANGIVVGDHDAQAAHHHATRHDPDYVLARIPETHHQDWLSALQDATAR